MLGPSQSVDHLCYGRWYTAYSILSEQATVLLEQFIEVRRVVAHLKGGLLQKARVHKSHVWSIDSGGLLTGERVDVIIVIIIRHSRVGSCTSIYIFSFIQRRCSSPGGW